MICLMREVIQGQSDGWSLTISPMHEPGSREQCWGCFYPCGGEWLWRGVLVVKDSDCKVENCLFMGGETHNLRKLQLVKNITDVEAIKIPTYYHLGGRVPHL